MATAAIPKIIVSPRQLYSISVELGCDPELFFSLVDGGAIVGSERVFPPNGVINYERLDVNTGLPAPGTTVVMTGPAVRDAVRPLTRTAPRVFSRALRCSLLVDAAAHPATNTATTAPAIMRRYPGGAGTVTSWHGPGRS